MTTTTDRYTHTTTAPDCGHGCASLSQHVARLAGALMADYARADGLVREHGDGPIVDLVAARLQAIVDAVADDPDDLAADADDALQELRDARRRYHEPPDPADDDARRDR